MAHTRPDLRQRQGEKRADWIERVQQTQQAEEAARSGPGVCVNTLRKGSRRARRAQRPAWGSQEWAETHGDDLGESPDC